ncbi:MAG TPA: YdeI/OmpD-associated family protein [Pyrinomonadaceae bacterium]|jgi:uncharacterized protein YdeI (YjbR/CyaY-like superfamily)|nr:YdeI/OmpD-associated family protein [Pyrinomonadaceae bacterium]
MKQEPKEPKTLYVQDRVAWRAWLEEHHATEREVWLVYYKKHTGRPRVPYDDAVEEALCFGWIDSIVRRVDDDSYLQKFTPRRDKSNWCESNVRRARKLITEGRMTKAGLDAIAEGALDTEFAPKPKSKDVEVPRFVSDALKKTPRAFENFNALAPSYRREYVGWITQAKREETRERRLAEAARLLSENKKLGTK